MRTLDLGRFADLVLLVLVLVVEEEEASSLQDTDSY